MAISGHTLLYSNIGNWAKAIALQLKYPDTTNEEKFGEKACEYLEIVASRIVRSLELEKFGEKDKYVEVCWIPHTIFILS